MAKEFKATEHIPPVEAVDLGGELGFTFTLANDRGTEQPITITSTAFCELVVSVTAAGALVARDYEFTMGAAVSSGADLARRAAKP